MAEDKTRAAHPADAPATAAAETTVAAPATTDAPATDAKATAEAEAWLAQLETMRRSVDLRLDAEGRWYHQGQPFEHARLIAAFDRGLDVHEDTGEAILRLGGRWCYVQADDTPFVVRRLRLEGDTLSATLNTGETHPVPAQGFEQHDGHLYTRLTPRRRARLDRAAHARLGDWLVETDAGLCVEAAGRRWPITSLGTATSTPAEPALPADPTTPK